MDAITIETIPTAKSILNTKISDDIDEDEIRLRLSDDEEVDPETSRSIESSQASLQPKHKGKRNIRKY